MEKVNQSESKLFIKIMKGTLFALCISMILILIFAFFLKTMSITDSVIRPINQIIKGVSILFGAIIGLRKSREQGFFAGLLIGLLYTVLAFILFSVFQGKFEFTKLIINDLLFGAITGSVSGIIAVNLVK